MTRCEACGMSTVLPEPLRGREVCLFAALHPEEVCLFAALHPEEHRVGAVVVALASAMALFCAAVRA